MTHSLLSAGKFLLTRQGTRMVAIDIVDELPNRVRLHCVADIRAAAGIDFDAKFMGLRHGGNTEGGDADLTDAQIRALSGHKTAAMTALYTKATMKQRQAGARKRLEARTKGGNLSK